MVKLFKLGSLHRHVMTGLTPMLLLGCSTAQLTPSPAYAQAAPNQAEFVQRQEGMDSQLMFEIMISELAGRRGQLDVAMTGYLRASERTDDPRVSERAARLTTFGRQWEDAETASRRWLSLDPDAEEAPQFLAQALIRQGKSDEAATQYIAVVGAAEDKEEALRDIQATLQSTGDNEDIVDIMRQLSAAYPESIEGQLGVARALLTAGDRPAALAATQQALTIDPKNTQALLLQAETLRELGQADQALGVLQASLADDEDNQSLRLGYAQLLVQLGRFDAVGSELDKIFIAERDEPDTLLRIASLALDSLRVGRASVYLKQLLTTGEYQDQANYYLARISDQQLDYIEAISYYDEVQAGDLQIRSQIRAAELVGLLGDVETGRERLRELATVQTNPDVQARIISAESRLLQSADRAPEAVQVLSDGLKTFPDNGDLLYARALAADTAGNPDMLVADLNRLIELEPDNAHAHNALGYHLTDNNTDLDRAEILLLKANELLPNDPAIMDSLGWLYYRQGKLDQSADLLRSAYGLFADSEIAAHLGEVLWLSGREQEARQLIQDALVDSPEDDHLLSVKRKFFE